MTPQERKRERRKAWEAANKEHLAAYRRAYREKHLERLRGYHREWKRANRDRINARRRAQWAEQRAAKSPNPALARDMAAEGPAR